MKKTGLHLILVLGLMLNCKVGYSDPETPNQPAANSEAGATQQPAAPEQVAPEENAEQPVAEPVFNPSEEISEDLSVPFPVDI